MKNQKKFEVPVNFSPSVATSENYKLKTKVNDLMISKKSGSHKELDLDISDIKEEDAHKGSENLSDYFGGVSKQPSKKSSEISEM